MLRKRSAMEIMPLQCVEASQSTLSHMLSFVTYETTPYYLKISISRHTHLEAIVGLGKIQVNNNQVYKVY